LTFRGKIVYCCVFLKPFFVCVFNPTEGNLTGGETMNTETLNWFKKDLEERKKKLLTDAAKTVSSARKIKKAIAGDFGDQALLESDRNLQLRIKDRERKLITKIDHTLEKIADGSFGKCISCGCDIAVERLKARPVASLCIDCKTIEEELED
jgi:DnaK suppressor protein